MQNVGEEVDTLEHGEHGCAEICEAFAVIVAAVAGIALKIVLVVDKVIGYVVLFKAHNAAVKVSPGKAYVEHVFLGHFFAPFRTNRGIERHYDANVHVVAALFLDGSGERTDNVAKTARCGKGHSL